ncbi:calcium-binding protein, partial [Phaeobacter sp. B1627]|uniref:calcium-binding protein n=1 Tax=Phaeobacter sp. B1627 TaxID=2583809 RepID=UPI001118587F
YGGNNNDTLDGGSGDDTLEGGTGADHLIGGNGTDLVSYDGASSGVVADFLILSSNAGDAEGDTYASVENLSGSTHRDRLYANDSNNKLWGQNGDDDLHGRNGNDSLYGGNNNDRLNGGLGADRLDGGSGTDEAAYWDATSGVRADLSNASSNTGEAAGDTYISIENIAGSNHADTLVGNSGNNTLLGRDGADKLYG